VNGVVVDQEPNGHVRRRFMAGKASVIVAGSTREGGALAASIAAETLIARVAEHGSASVILASGNSQLAFFAALRERTDIPWSRIAIFHMDEYIGLEASHPKGFRRYFRDQLVDGVQVRAFHEMAGDAADIDAEMRRYTDLLRADPPDICVLGIGENCHLAFNDPPADFTTTDAIHVVEVSLASRRQQVGEGHFPSVEDVPTHALTLTIPTLLAPAVVLAVVPEGRKAAAVALTIEGPISPDVPATILRETDGVTIVLDPDSAARLG
jgi:6-phosphogluconolactonase/Glucosamine-6-phosphate isomerase/deaminase